MLATTRTAVLMALALASGAPAAFGQLQFQLPGEFGSGAGFDPLAGAAPDELVTLSARYTAPTGDTPAMLAVTAKIAAGYHIYSVTQPKGGPQATRLNLDEAAGVERLGDWVADPAPETHFDEVIWGDLPIEEHTGEVTWRAPIRLPEGVDPTAVAITGSADLQACTATTCNPVDDATFTAELAPRGSITQAPVWDSSTETAADSGVAPAPGGEVVAPTRSLPVILGFALLGGLILNLMPCVLPVIGLKVLSFAEQAGHDRGKVLAMNLAYTAGLMSVFLLLAALASFAGYGWGEVYTHAEFKIGMVVLVFAMALSFLGVWEIPIPGFAGGRGANELQQQEGYSGAFFKGVFTTVLATPCSGPFLFPVFSATLGAPPATVFLIFGFVGLGMASPYLLIGLFPSLVSLLP